MSYQPPPPGGFPPYPPTGQDLYRPYGQQPYPPQPGYPNPGQPSGYPPAPAPGGYPPAPGGYPPATQPGYPPASQPGYPPASQPGYPPASQPGYPPAAQPGYPPPAGQPGYPPPAGQPGYPPPAGQPGYPPPAGQPGYPPPAAQSGYPAAAQPGYPNAPPHGQPGYPPSQPPHQGGYPPAPGGPGGYPPAPGGYPSAPGGYPPAPGGYPAGGGQQSHLYYQAPVPTMSADVYAPSVHPAQPFNPQQDCEALRKAMKGFGTDEAALIGVLCHRSWQQRNELERTFKQMFGKDLEKDITSETSGDFRKLLVRLLKTPIELAAWELHDAVAGAGTDEECLVEIICTRSNQDLRAIEHKYHQLFGRPLEKDVSSDTSGYFRRLLVSLLSCNRPPDGPPDMAAAQADARALYDAGQKRVGTDEVRFNAILSSRSYTQLRAIFDVYAREYKKDIIDVIKSEFSGDIEKALKAVVNAIRNRQVYFAERLHTAMKGAGTRDQMLIRIIVSRCDFDLGAIKTEFQRMHGKPLSSAVSSETSGDYKKGLLALIGN